MGQVGEGGDQLEGRGSLYWNPASLCLNTPFSLMTILIGIIITINTIINTIITIINILSSSTSLHLGARPEGEY